MLNLLQIFPHTSAVLKKLKARTLDRLKDNMWAQEHVSPSPEATGSTLRVSDVAEITVLTSTKHVWHVQHKSGACRAYRTSNDRREKTH
jgi:hypothetical protein